MLVVGWPGSGKTTLARALARELGLAYLGKDEVKEALMDALDAPSSVPESQRLGRAAVHCVLRVARGCPGAVIDSTLFSYTLPLVRELPGPLVEIRCQVEADVARRRYGARRRDERHLDDQRTERELWGQPVLPLGVGPLVVVDTGQPVDAAEIAAKVRAALSRRPA